MLNNFAGEEMQLFVILSAAAILVGILLFILWVWSMISMINLSSNFSDFLDEYSAREANCKPVIREDIIVTDDTSSVSTSESKPHPQDKKRLMILIGASLALISIALVITYLVTS